MLTRGLFDRFTGGSTTAGGTPAAASAAPAAPAASAGGIDRPITPPANRVLPGSDPASRLLPHAPEAAEKLAAMRRSRDRARSHLRDLEQRRMELGDEKRRAEDYLNRLRAMPRGGGRGPLASSTHSTYLTRGVDAAGHAIEHHEPSFAGDRQIEQAEQRLADARAALDELGRQINEEQAQISRLPDEADRWLRSIPADVRIEPHREGRAGRKALPDATPAAVAEHREQLLRLCAEIPAVRAASPPIASVIAGMHQQIDTLAERGRPDYLGAVESGRPIKFREQQVQMQTATAAGIGMTMHSSPDLLALFAYVHRDALVAKLEADLSELADDESALTDQQKADREQELRAEILDLERIDVVLTEQLGLPYREDTDIRALLGLSSDLPPNSIF